MLTGSELTPTAALDEKEQPWRRPVVVGARRLVFVRSAKIFEARGVTALPANATASLSGDGRVLGPRNGGYRLTVNGGASVSTAGVRATIARVPAGGSRSITLHVCHEQGYEFGSRAARASIVDWSGFAT